MSKKKHKVMEEERKNFIHGIVDDKGNVLVPGTVRNGISEKAANEIFDQMMDFASYAFNKSHAAAYAVVAYQTAYLKRYYPVEFLAAMLTSVMGSNDKIAFYIESCKMMGIEVLPPDINESSVTFTVSNGKIRFGLAAVKNVGRSAIISIIRARKEKGRFVSFTDFCQKISDGELNKRAVESLIKSGAFDSMGSFRSQLLAIFEQVMDGVSQDRKRNLDGQISLFDISGGKMNSVTDIVPNIKEFEKKHLLAMEKEMTGLYLSGHPLSEYSDELETDTTINTSEIQDNIGGDQEHLAGNSVELDNRTVVMGGIITSVKIKSTKSGSIMAFITLEDIYGSIEVLVFPKVHEKFSKLVFEDSIVLIKGRLSVKEEETPKLLAEDIKPLKKHDNSKLYLKVPMSRYGTVISEIKSALSSTKGQTPVYLCIEDEINNKKDVRVAGRDLWVEVSEELLKKLYGILGEESVKVC
jgi:DNA polymerase-3 subunit alpha